MMERRRILALALGLALLGCMVSAVGLGYSSGVNGLAITETNRAITFTDNHSGGTSSPFNARGILIRPRTGSDTCHVDIQDSTATTDDMPLPAGSTLIREWDNTTGGTGGGWPSIGAICGTGKTATWDVDAWR
jgi:hypothetical protein